MPPQFCDVAVPVPLDATFTYRTVPGQNPSIGGRVLVPFREQRLSGIVTALHDREPDLRTKSLLQIIDPEPALDPILMQLGQWIAHYYIAPIGEVYRTMLPLGAEVRRARTYCITDLGWKALHDSANIGSSLRSRKSPEEQRLEYSVLDHLSDGSKLREQTLRGATGVSRELLNALVAKKWIAREDVTATRDASRTISVVTLTELVPTNAAPESFEPRCAPDGPKRRKLNPNQTKILEILRNAGGRLLLEELREQRIPKSSIDTLANRGLLHIVKEPEGFQITTLRNHPRSLEFQFNAAQQAALSQIKTDFASKVFSVSLLHGVTGSGKTAVYLAAMRAVLDAGNSAIMLVPEIGLTPAAAAQLHDIFGADVAILHSALSDDERAEQWHRIKRGECRIVVGTRSAIFAPVSNLALVVVDEEHDLSYKQQEAPRYHARDVAIMRAKLSNAAVVLGSATPSLESFHNAGKKYQLITLPERVERRPLPEVEVIDMREEFADTGHEQLVSRKLISEIGDRLQSHEQVLVLLNRRGYSPVALCRSCGHTIECQNCAIPLTHHKSTSRLQCHYCGFMRSVPKKCPECSSEYIYYVGAGSEKLEECLHGLFPQARIARLDRDTVKGRYDFERVLNSLNAGELDIVVGTQMIAKGHDIHGVTLVGIVGADTALRFPDFRAAERTFQLLTQVSGRAGRGDSAGRVILQTYFPDHYAIQFAAKHDYAGFYEKEIRFRNWMKYPPVTALANVLIRSDHSEEALRFAGIIGRWFETEKPDGVKILGPAAAPIVRLKRDYRYHFILKSNSREKLNTVLRQMLTHAADHKISRVNIVVDVDAQNLM